MNILCLCVEQTQNLFQYQGKINNNLVTHLPFIYSITTTALLHQSAFSFLLAQITNILKTEQKVLSIIMNVTEAPKLIHCAVIYLIKASVCNHYTSFLHNWVIINANSSLFPFLLTVQICCIFCSQMVFFQYKYTDLNKKTKERCEKKETEKHTQQNIYVRNWNGTKNQ